MRELHLVNNEIVYTSILPNKRKAFIICESNAKDVILRLKNNYETACKVDWFTSLELQHVLSQDQPKITPSMSYFIIYKN